MIPSKKRHLLQDAGNDNYDGSGNGRQTDFDANNGTLRNKRSRTNLSNIGNDYQSSNEDRYSRDRAIRVATHWRTIGSGAIFGSGPLGGRKVLPRMYQVAEYNMGISVHGWKFQAGYWIPFFGIALRHPLAFQLTFGTTVRPQYIVGLQMANSVLDSRYHFSISRRDVDRGSRSAGVVFVHLSVKSELLRDCREGYILADLASMMEFLGYYQSYLDSWTNGMMYPDTIDVSFRAWLVKHRELPHPQNHVIPVSNNLRGSPGSTNADGRSFRSSAGSTPPTGPRYLAGMTTFTAYKPVTGGLDPPKSQRPWVNRTIISGSVAPILSSAGSVSPPTITVASASSNDAKISLGTEPVAASITQGTKALSLLGIAEPLREETTKAFKIATGRRMRELYDNKYTGVELVAEVSKDSGIFAADSRAALSLTIRRYLRERYDGKGSNEEILAALAEDFLVFPKELGY
ncbi:hypothetical protein BGAL_0595g00020 [Botrytis galanthina]|uniref:Uncharacterized protein n=1 Tax=Botrytis galanthina TaxID=278940 RepID=A0A4S8QMC9_9HELO|nr:hypothetical protein BGAL_0595g00020 [Botrytis galanthina]